MVVKRQCSFCAGEVEPGTGTMFVKRDGAVFYFCSSSCRKQQLHLGRVGHRLKWTRAHALKRAQQQSASAKSAARPGAAPTGGTKPSVPVPKSTAPTAGSTPSATSTEPAAVNAALAEAKTTSDEAPTKSESSSKPAKTSKGSRSKAPKSPGSGGTDS